MNSWNEYMVGVDSRFAPSQWETSLQSNTVSHWLGANLESALYYEHGASDQLWITSCQWLIVVIGNCARTALLIMLTLKVSVPYIDGILLKGPYPPCLRMADRAILAGHPRHISDTNLVINQSADALTFDGAGHRHTPPNHFGYTFISGAWLSVNLIFLSIRVHH